MNLVAPNRAFVGLLVLAIGLSAAGARASDDDDARSAMLRGTAAYGKGDAEGALVEYRRAIVMAPKANLPHRYAAEALVQLGRFDEAFVEFDTYLGLNPGVSDANDVRARVAQLRAKHLPARATIAASEANAVVRVDDGPTPIALPTVLALTPGSHVLVVEKPGFGPNRREVRVAGDENLDLTFTLLPLSPPPPIERRAPTEPVPPAAEKSWVRTTGIVSMVSGGAIVATSLVLDLTVLRSKIDAVDDAASRNATDLGATKEDASRWQTGVGVAYAIGGALVLGGAALYLFAPEKSRPVRFRASPFGAKLDVTF